MVYHVKLTLCCFSHMRTKNPCCTELMQLHVPVCKGCTVTMRKWNSVMKKRLTLRKNEIYICVQHPQNKKETYFDCDWLEPFYHDRALSPLYQSASVRPMRWGTVRPRPSCARSDCASLCVQSSNLPGIVVSARASHFLKHNMGDVSVPPVSPTWWQCRSFHAPCMHELQSNLEQTCSHDLKISGLEENWTLRAGSCSVEGSYSAKYSGGNSKPMLAF